ncbi:hypothetical protein GCM10023206_06440 [Acinetobacter puyangensis]|uniref:Filamentous hemagglutinin n=1 Tax=Acinetobacter puyangensis TaxID=1096779 RepID=A0A240EBY4_9GAMM|nr:filamentous hemagglutinin [Acinetobacter puyangensis]
MNNFATSVGLTLVQTAINGGNLSDNLEKALLARLAGALQGELASQIGTSLDKVDPNVLEYTIHKIAHAAAGCAAAAATKASCEAGAIGAGVGEIVAELMIPNGKTSLDLTDAERTKIKDTTKILAGTVAAFTGYDVNTAANSANIAVENNSLAKLATTGGKIAYKVAKQIKEAQAKGQKLNSADVVEMFKKEGVQGIVDIGDNIATLINPAASIGDKAFAAIDLVIGVDLKAGKNVDALIKDKKITGKSFPKENLSFHEDKFKYLFGKAAFDPHNTPRSIQNKEQLASVGIFDNVQGRNRIIRHLADTINRSDNISQTFTKKVNGVDMKYEVRDSLLFGSMGVRKVESTFEIMPDGQRRFSTMIIKGGK